MSVLRRIGNFAKSVIRKVGDVGGKVIKGVSTVKNFADKTGITGAVTSALMSNPQTAPLAAGLALANPMLKAAGGVSNAMANMT